MAAKFLRRPGENWKNQGIKPRYTISQDVVAISDRRPVRTAFLPVPSEIYPHDHEFCEICLVAAGHGTHCADGARIPMAPGDVFVTLPGQVHAILPGPGLRVWNVYYLAEWFLRDLPEYRREPQLLGLFFGHVLFDLPHLGPVAHLRLDRATFTAARAELQAIAAESERTVPSPVFLTGCFGKLLHYLGGSAPPDGVRPLATLRADVWHVITRVEELLANGRPFDARHLAARAPVGADRLARLFKRDTGSTPFAYYQRRRLQLGRRLLLDPNRAITDIALSLGFADPSHFGREFRREYRLTPRAFRRSFIER